jgi:hypothetical protein
MNYSSVGFIVVELAVVIGLLLSICVAAWEIADHLRDGKGGTEK